MSLQLTSSDSSWLKWKELLLLWKLPFIHCFEMHASTNTYLMNIDIALYLTLSASKSKLKKALQFDKLSHWNTYFPILQIISKKWIHSYNPINMTMKKWWSKMKLPFEALGSRRKTLKTKSTVARWHFPEDIRRIPWTFSRKELFYKRKPTKKRSECYEECVKWIHLIQKRYWKLSHEKLTKQIVAVSVVTLSAPYELAPLDFSIGVVDGKRP